MIWTSRRLQNANHIVGGTNSLLLLFSGICIGQGNWLHTLITITCYLVLTRISSEIFYRVLKELEIEHKAEPYVDE